MTYQFIQITTTGAVGVITLNRPKANALSHELITEIGSAVSELEHTQAINAVLITGGEGKFFSGGADIPSLQGTLAEPFAPDTLLSAGLHTMDILERCTKPVIAAVNGFAVGGGCELALACHLRIAADTAQFGQPEINLGIVPGWGGCHRLPRLIGDARALDWLLTGRMVSAAEALAAGLVCKVVPAAELGASALELATLIASKPAVAARETLRVVRERALHPERGKGLEAEAFVEAAGSNDAKEGISAFLEKRSANFRGN